jgi:DNA uptake protein ComE-like DNA-binding protein
MAEDSKPEDAVDERVQNRPAFSWPGRRRAEEAAAAAEKAALQGLERLRGKSDVERDDATGSAAPEIEDGDGLRELVIEATQQLRDAIRIEANEIGGLLRAERESLEQAIQSLQEQIAEVRDGALMEQDSGGETDQLPPSQEEVADLNEASHADLCAIGMSETQASRVIRHRDFWGDFHSVSELDHVPGFAPAIRAELEQRLSVGR